MGIAIGSMLEVASFQPITLVWPLAQLNLGARRSLISAKITYFVQNLKNLTYLGNQLFIPCH